MPRDDHPTSPAGAFRHAARVFALGRRASPPAAAIASRPQHPDPADVVEGDGLRMQRHGRFIHTQVDRTEEEHRAVTTRMADSADAQREVLARQVADLEERLARVDTFTVLGGLLLQNHGTDPETYEEVSHQGKSVVSEFAALLALKRPYSPGTELYADGATLHALQEATEGVLTSATLLQFMRDARRMLAQADAAGATTPRSDAHLDMQRAMRSHETSVRNMAYEHHHHAVLRGLFGPMEDVLLGAVGVGVDEALRLARAVIDRLNDRVHERLTRARAESSAMAREVDRARRKRTRVAFLAEMAQAPDEETRERYAFVRELARRPEAWTRDYFRYATIEWLLVGAADLCTFTAQDLADATDIPIDRAEAFARAFSLEFGDVPADFVEPSPTHLLRTRPLIHHAGRYLCPAPMLLDWAIQPAFETALKGAGGNAWHRYEQHRHDYLLETSVGLLRRMMPGAAFDTNLLYDVEGERAREAELDALGRLDDVAFLVEAKGATVTDPARRGAPDRLRRDLRQVVGDSHAQAVRAKAHLAAAKARNEAARFRRARGGTDVVVPAGAVRESILLSVTLAPIGHVTAQLPADSELGLFEPGEYSWVVNLYDLMVIADLVDAPAQFPHYLTRRVHTARLGLLEASDELDLFMYYLAEGLYLDDVAAQEGGDDAIDGRRTVVRLLSYTGPIDAYYAHTTGSRRTPAPKPKQQIPTELRALLERLEASAMPGWLEAALALLDLSGESRTAFARGVENARKITRSQRRASNGSVVGRGDSSDAGWGVSYWCDLDAAAVARDLGAYCRRKRAEMGADRWVGIGEDVSSPDGRRVVQVVHLRPEGEAEASSRPHRTDRQSP